MSLNQALVTTLVVLAGPAYAGPVYNFTFFQVCPACSTGTGGVNNAGVGSAALNDNGQGYIVTGTTATAVIHPGSPLTLITVPHNDGRFPGAYLDTNSGAILPTIRQTDGSFTDYAGYPGAGFTMFLELNNNSDAVGYYAVDPGDPGGFRGFLYQGGAYTSLSYPGAAPGESTFLLGLNESGVLVGYSGDVTTSTLTGIIRDPDGTWKSLQYPGADSTILWGINNPGTVVGGYRDANGWHPFLYQSGEFSTFAVPGFSNAALTGINDLGGLIGNTIAPGPDAFGGPQTGFFASPVPEPAAGYLLGTALAVLLGIRWRGAVRRA